MTKQTGKDNETNDIEFNATELKVEKTGQNSNNITFDSHTDRDAIRTDYDTATDNLPYENVFDSHPNDNRTFAFEELSRAFEMICQS